MCGFVGRISRQMLSSEALANAALEIQGRGPDGSRSWRSDCGRVVFVHARLAIVDPDERAMQPFSGSSGSGNKDVLVFNGEVYNYRELRDSLVGYPFRTDSDTEVLFAGLQRYGVKFLGAVRGSLSGAWYDSARNQVLLFRDPVGKKPLLFWRQKNGDVLFGSSLRAMQRMSSERGVVREAALRDIMLQGYVEPPDSLYDGVCHFLPGETLKISADGLEISRSQISCPPAILYEGEPSAEVDQRVHTLLDTAVRRRLENNPAPAALFSGGIDSTIVVELALRQLQQQGKELTVYSLKPFFPRTNDQPYADMAAKRLGLTVNWVGFSINNIGGRIINALSLQDEPLAMPSFFVISELVRRVGVSSRVLLSGDGGDEVFLGYGEPDYWGNKRAARAGVEMTLGVPAPTWFESWARRCVTSELFAHGFQKLDRSSAEQGVEVRSPLLDIDLLSYARSLPASELLRNGQSKSLLKAQLVDWPPQFLRRRKVGAAYNLRWHWMLSNFDGLREGISPQLVLQLGASLPESLRCDPNLWKARNIFTHFSAAYAALAISLSLKRLQG